MFKIKAVASALALIAFTVCVSSAMTSTPGFAQTTGTVTVTGKVTTSDGKAVSNARVYVPGSNEATRTDANGNYTLPGVPGGPQVVVVRQRGYAPVQVDAKFSTKPSDRGRNHVNVTLLTPTELATTTAQAARDSAALDKVGFFRREAAGSGAYLRRGRSLKGRRRLRRTVFDGCLVCHGRSGGPGRFSVARKAAS
jgi:hypothetical protein